MEAELLQQMFGGGSSTSSPEQQESLDWFQAFTLLKSVGHSLHEIENMGLEEFRGYMRAALWLRNLNASQALNIATLSSSAAASGNDELFEQISRFHEELKTAHKNV